MLAKENEEKRYLLRRLLDSKEKKENENPIIEDEDYEPVFTRAGNLSSIRLMAEKTARDNAAKIANPLELTEAERIFQETLERDKKYEPVQQS